MKNSALLWRAKHRHGQNYLHLAPRSIFLGFTVCELLRSLVTIGVVTKAFLKKQNGCLTAKLWFLALKFLSPFLSMSLIEAAKATENCAVTFRKSETVINCFRPQLILVQRIRLCICVQTTRELDRKWARLCVI